MGYRFYLVSLLFILSGCGGCSAPPATSSGEEGYIFREGSRDGIGKFYLGREISGIMGFAGKDWLERSEREQEEGVSLVLANLPLTDSSVVADIGAGSGYYSFRLAKKVPDGFVYAVEVQKEAIDYLRAKKEALGYSHVLPVLGSDRAVNLPEATLDLAILVDVYHELEFPKEMLQSLRKSLKSSGKLVLIEYRGEDPAIPIKELHKMTVLQAKKELRANGFSLVENGQFLPIQHFLVFEKVTDE